MDRGREHLLFLANLTPARFSSSSGKSGYASNSSAIERAIANAKFSELFCKRQMDIPKLKEKDPGVYEQACEVRRICGELLDAPAVRRNGHQVTAAEIRRIKGLYEELTNSLKSLFWIVDATPVDQKPLWRVCCQRL